MTEKNDTLHNKHDKMFKKMTESLSDIEALLHRTLPKPLLNALDLSHLQLDETQYGDNRFNESRSERVVKTRMKKKKSSPDAKQEYLETDIYILFEHKSELEIKIFIQLLYYMCMMWQLDLKNDKPPRVIIPVVFYHGKQEWSLPLEFKGQFDVDDSIQDYLLNFRYVLFNTKNWNLSDEEREEIDRNLFLMSALSVLKHAFSKGNESVLPLFRIWTETGSASDKEEFLYIINYIIDTKKLSKKEMNELIMQSKIDGGETMATWLEKEIEEKLNQGRQEGLREAALRMLKKGVDIKTIAECTDLSKEEIKKLSETIH